MIFHLLAWHLNHLAILVDISKSKIRYKTPKMPERNDCNFLNIEIQDMTSRPKLISIVSGIQLNDQNLINPNIFSENSNYIYFIVKFWNIYFFIIFLYIYSIWALNRGHYPYKWLWTYAGDKFFEAEGEIKFSPVYAHDLLLLKSCRRWTHQV